MKRRTFLAGGATAVVGLSSQPAFSQSPPAAGQPIAPADIQSAAARLRAQFLKEFDAAYVENVILPHFLVSTYDGERPVVPMIDVTLTKENALPTDLWGLLSKSWRPAPEDGVTVFLQGLEKRGPDNERKRIYMSAVTPDLYAPMYREKVARFFDTLLAQDNAGKPLMGPYLDHIWDLYWDLHLGVTGKDIPDQVRQIGLAFNTVLAYRDPTQKIVYENYMTVRKNLDFLKSWIDGRLADISSGKTPAPEKTFAWYWMKNAGNGENFAHKDVVFECFHNFVAFSQWGNTLYNIMLKLGEGTGDPDAKAWFKKTMEGDPDKADGTAFPPLERFVMELFRLISPNGGSISALEEIVPPAFERAGYIISPHTSTSLSPIHWKNPQAFDPSRYERAPTSAEIDEARVEKMGMAQCPFSRTSFEVKDGRKASMDNSGFGTVFGVADGKALPVCDYAGFAPFGFGYRRCPGEQLTINVFEDFLRKVWKDKITFAKLSVAKADVLPIGPRTVIADDIGFILLFVPRGAFASTADPDGLLDKKLRNGASVLLADFLARLSPLLPRLRSGELPGVEAALRGLVAASVTTVLSQPDSARDVLETTLLERARRLIQQRLADPELSATILCRELFVSRSRLYRLFAPMGGVAAYIRRQRLLRARDVLIDVTEVRSIIRIAEQLGFSDASAFSRTFKQQFGVSPRQMRATRRALNDEPRSGSERGATSTGMSRAGLLLGCLRAV